MSRDSHGVRIKARPRGAKYPDGFRNKNGPVMGMSRTNRRMGRKSVLRTWQRG